MCEGCYSFVGSFVGSFVIFFLKGVHSPSSVEESACSCGVGGVGRGVWTDRGEKGWLAIMPLYDFVVMVKPAVDRRNLVEFMTRVGQCVYTRSGVVTNIKSFGRVNLAYNIKKRDRRFSEVNL